ncbi:2-nitropropane dioxygenase [Burkholderia contaminans FFH2055]|nr:DUF6306 domain-containing protein [Burkholderia contaminans]KKL30860.1 2-nitropropane dioxygenase [Burkholderia contaminans FFH2055]MEB4631777.1 DUF6306 domain-containing protein [Burkholderia contaminans]MEB4637362.1 DUF6306 domain-containing protein [Burkholderia contaminans]MEB4652446.1 DUF6306 domain-containing protein [Burkholderia contaminans]MEB4660882.1 DUF6306 domain-containing protein [Burkholderia contaminans]
MSNRTHDDGHDARRAKAADESADAQRDALLALLNELLEAERAGARVASETAAEIEDPELHRLVASIRQDEAHWCAVLVDAIRSLDATPTHATGAFYEKAMAIEDLPERLAFLNRGQRWVVRKLQALLPTLAQPDMHHALTQMLVAHEKNIGSVDVQLRIKGGGSESGVVQRQ